MRQGSLFANTEDGPTIVSTAVVRKRHLLVSVTNGWIASSLEQMMGNSYPNFLVRAIGTKSLTLGDGASLIQTFDSVSVIVEAERGVPENLSSLIRSRLHQRISFVGFYTNENSARLFEKNVSQLTRAFGSFRSSIYYDVNRQGCGSENKNQVVIRKLEERFGFRRTRILVY